MKRLLILFFLFSAPAMAQKWDRYPLFHAAGGQTHTFPALDTNNAFTGNNTHSGTETFTGPLLPINIDQVAYCDQFAGATVTNKLDACVSNFGASSGVGIISSTMGVGSATSCGSGLSKGIVFFDFRGLNGGAVPIGDCAFTFGPSSDGSLTSMFRSSYTWRGPFNAQSYEANTFVGQFTGDMTNLSTQSIEASTGNCITFGALTNVPVSLFCVGVEGDASINSTGGIIPTAIGTSAQVRMQNAGGSTNITDAMDFKAVTQTKVGAGTITNAYGLFADTQTAGSTRNYSIYGRSQWLIGGNSGGGNNVDWEDHLNAPQRFLQSDSSDDIIINGIGGFIRMQDKAGNRAWSFSSPNFDFDPSNAGVRVRFGTTGSTGGISVGAGGTFTSSGNGGTMASVVASGTSTMVSGSVGAAACAAAVTASATGVATTDSIEWAYATAPTLTTDALLHISPYVTSANVNFTRCNPTAGAIVGTAIVINWKVIR